MGQGGALLPQVTLLRWNIHHIAILIGVEQLPEVVIRVAQAHPLTRQANIVNVEIREAWAHYSHSNHRAESTGDDGDVENQSELTDLISELEH